MSIKRHFYKGQHYLLDKDSKQVVLLPEFHKKLLEKQLWGRFGFKKIGGSSLGDVLEVDQYKSRFMAFCRMAWIGVPILDRKYVDAGIAIEPKVIEALEEKTKQKIETYPGPKYNFDYFADKDDVVGGLPDGFIKEMNLILEIKTTGSKNFDKWNKWGVPAGYLKQAQMYAHLMGSPKYSIIATFLEPEDYADPSNYPIKKRKMKSWTIDVDQAGVLDDIKKVKEFYYEHTKTGTSPVYDEQRDAELLQYLDCSSIAEWDELQDKWKTIGKIPA